MFNVVLLEPEIPANTGNIGRTCLVTGSRLHLIEPMGFILNDKNLKRAGMDYWHDLDVTVYDSFRDFVAKNLDRIHFTDKLLGFAGLNPSPVGDDNDSEPGADANHIIIAEGRERDNGSKAGCNKADIWLATTKALKTHDQAAFKDGDYIMFGKESAGIPEEILMASRDTCIRIPMAKGQRSLNLSNSAAVVLYEALRQNNYLDLEHTGRLHHHNWT